MRPKPALVTPSTSFAAEIASNATRSSICQEGGFVLTACDFAHKHVPSYGHKSPKQGRSVQAQRQDKALHLFRPAF